MHIDDLVVNSCAHAEISENFEMLRIQGTLHPQTRVACELIVDELRLMPERDRFELIVEADGNLIKLNGFDNAKVRVFFEELKEYDDLESADISLTVTKVCASGRMSIYSLDCFVKYLASETIADILEGFQQYHFGFLELEIQHQFSECSTATIAFVGRNQATSLAFGSMQERQEKLDLLSDNCTVAHQSDRFLPTDFAFVVPSENVILQNFFSSICATLCIRYIANHSSLRGNLFDYKIVGYKTITAENVDAMDLLPSKDTILKVFNWAYNGAGNSDKIGLIRNVCSLHLDATGRIQFTQQLWTAIQSNYQIYLKGNVENYLEVKSRVSQMVVDFGSKTFEFSDQMLNSFKASALLILTFLLTVVLVNGLKDAGESTIFSSSYVFVVLVIAVVSALWLFLTRDDVLGRFNTAAQSIKDILNFSFSQILLEAEIRQTVEPMITLNRTYLMSQMRKYTIWWSIILSVFVLAFVTGHFIFIKPDLKSNGATESQASTEKNLQPVFDAGKPTQAGKSLEEPIAKDDSNISAKAIAESKKLSKSDGGVSDSEKSTKNLSGSQEMRTRTQ
jgi:hypothetical protein